MSDDPLDQLFVTDEEVIEDSRALLFKMVSPFAQIKSGSGQVDYKEAADALNAKQKILIYLLCRLAIALKNGANAADPVLPRDIELATDLPGGTVRPRVKMLLDDRIVTRTDAGYAVQTGGLRRAFKELEAVLPKA